MLRKTLHLLFLAALITGLTSCSGDGAVSDAVSPMIQTDDPIGLADNPIDEADDPIDQTDEPVSRSGDPSDDPMDPMDDPVDETDDPVDQMDETITPIDGWLIPRGEVRDGGPGKDGIPALTDPTLISASQADFMDDGDLVIGIRIDDEVRAYPHSILDWHEIINDTVGDRHFAITYCPLTGTGIGWNRILWGETTTFGVSGLLYNSNLITYDRATDSNWSQMLGRSVNGELIGDDIETTRIIETTWKTWQMLFPQTKVVSTNTGYFRRYSDYPYGSYRTNDNLVFPIRHNDTRLPKKERVHGVRVDDMSKVYPINGFPGTFLTIDDTVNGQPIVVVGNAALNLVASYKRTTTDGTVLTFEPLPDSLPAVMEDQEGTRWDILGKGLEGPRVGTHLALTSSYNAYWFAWGTFFTEAEIHSFAG